MGKSMRRSWPYFAISLLGLAIGLWGMQGLLPQLSRLHFAIILLEGLVFLAVSLVVFAPRAERGPMRDLFWCLLLYGVATMIHGLYVPRSRSLGEWIFPAIWIACLTTLPVLFFRMTQTFPRARPLLTRRPQLMPALWIGSAALIAWQVAAAYHYFLAPTPGALAWLRLPRAIAEISLVLAVGLGWVTLYRSGQKLDVAWEREQTRWLLWGITLGVAPYVFFRALPKLMGITSTIPPEVDRLIELAIPLAFTFAVVRSKLLDIDIIIRRSLIYGILAAVLASIDLLVGVVAAQRIAARAPHSLVWMQLLAVALPVILYTPARRWIGSWVDRTFFKIQYDYARALVVFQEQIRGASSQEEIVELTRVFIGAELQVDSVAVLARRGSAILAAAEPESPQDAEAMLEAADTTGIARRLLAAPASTTRPDLESPRFPSLLQGAGYRLALPFTVGERMVGALIVGEKRSERRFIEEDLRLLYAVRSESEGALERVELVQRAYEAILTSGDLEDRERPKPDAVPEPPRQLTVALTGEGAEGSRIGH
jgi:GAF domain-containing protein